MRHSIGRTLLTACSLALTVLAGGCGSEDAGSDVGPEIPPDLVLPGVKGQPDPMMPPMSTCTTNCTASGPMIPTPAKSVQWTWHGEFCTPTYVTGQGAGNSTYPVEITNVSSMSGLPYAQAGALPTNRAQCQITTTESTLYGHKVADNMWYKLGSTSRVGVWHVGTNTFTDPSYCMTGVIWSINKANYDRVILDGRVYESSQCTSSDGMPLPCLTPKSIEQGVGCP